MPIYNDIRAKIGYSKMPHTAYVVFVGMICENLRDNPYFPNPPVDLAALQANIDRYSALLSAALDRSKTVILQRNSMRRELEIMVLQLAHYVEAASRNDPAIFATSGFERQPSQHIPATPLPPARILKIGHGSNSGVVRVTFTPSLRKVKHYELRYAIQDSDAIPDTWTKELFGSVNGPVTVRNLQPGATYAFQVRALGLLGFTDWSDAATFICT
jgi:hypothetical protein